MTLASHEDKSENREIVSYLLSDHHPHTTESVARFLTKALGSRVKPFCPRDARFVWKKNGQTIAGVKEQFHDLADGRMHLLSWVTDAIAQDSEYCCLVVSKAGSRISKVVISVEGRDQDGWPGEFASWKSVISEHDKMMESWKKTWESCNTKGKVEGAKREQGKTWEHFEG